MRLQCGWQGDTAGYGCRCRIAALLLLSMPDSTERGKRDHRGKKSRWLSKVSFQPSLVLGCLLLVSFYPCASSWRWLGCCGCCEFLPAGYRCQLLEGVFNLCCCSQPAPHQGPGAQGVGDAAARDRGPADCRGKAAAQRQLVSGGFRVGAEGNPYPDVFCVP